jgi:hypothetical protein
MKVERQRRTDQPLPVPPRRSHLALVDALDQPPEHLSSLALLGLGHGMAILAWRAVLLNSRDG